MTAHFLDFPTSNASTDRTLQTIGVKYLLLYAPGDRKSYSEDYAMLRPLADQLGHSVIRLPGIYLDAHRDYFSSDSFGTEDTLIVYQIAQ
jgi:hypothetical protein